MGRLVAGGYGEGRVQGPIRLEGRTVVGKVSEIVQGQKKDFLDLDARKLSLT